MVDIVDQTLLLVSHLKKIKMGYFQSQKNIE